jgi:membrane protease YdiL (CAAX protease family)
VNTNHSSTQGAETSNPKLKTLVWGAIFIVNVPQIIYRLLVSRMPGEPYNPIWLALAEVVILTMLCVMTWAWTAVKPLRGFVLALLAIFVGTFFIIPYTHEIVSQLNWIQHASWGVRLVAIRLEVHLVQVVLMALTLIGSGLGRRELFLVLGNPSAPFEPSRLLPAVRDVPKSWTRVVLEWLPYYIIILGIVLALQIRPSMSQIFQVLIFLPGIIIGAAINAFGEEFEFRSILLARLEPVLGSNSAILMSSAVFGLMHYFGTPGGPFGVVLTGYLGWLMAKSMIETRGFVWAFSIHFIGDFVIYCGSATLS